MNKGMITKAFKIFLEQQKPTTGRPCEVGYWRILRAIIYKLRTGIQWRLLPMKELFGRFTYGWSSVYYHYNKWVKVNAFQDAWESILRKNKHELDLSISNIDGSHTIAKKGGEKVAYQKRKRAKTTNMLILTNRTGQPITCSFPISGNHHDVYNIEKTVSKMLAQIRSCGIPTEGLFLNADSGFDATSMKKTCISEEIILNVDRNKRNNKSTKDDSYFIDNKMYTNRFVVEQANAWMDRFRGLAFRYETSAQNWYSFHTA